MQLRFSLAAVFAVLALGACQTTTTANGSIAEPTAQNQMLMDTFDVIPARKRSQFFRMATEESGGGKIALVLLASGLADKCDDYVLDQVVYKRVQPNIRFNALFAMDQVKAVRDQKLDAFATQYGLDTAPEVTAERACSIADAEYNGITNLGVFLRKAPTIT